VGTNPTSQDLPVAVSSVAEEIRRKIGPIALVPTESLPYWLPGLSLPAGWTIATTPTGVLPATRIAVRRFTEQAAWDGCEVIALYQFAGTVPAQVVHDSADRSLHDLAAYNLQHHTVTPRAIPGATAVRSSGSFSLAGRSIWGQFTNYVVNTGLSGGLVEHSILVEARRRARLARDISALTDHVHRSLLTSIAAGQRSAHQRG
jgi:hypothetical protein